MGENPRIRGQLSPVGIFFFLGRGGGNHIAFIGNGGEGSVVSNRVLNGGQRKMTTTKRRSLHSYRDVEGQLDRYISFFFTTKIVRPIPLSHSKPWKSTSFQKFQPQTNIFSSELISDVNNPNFLLYYMPSANKSRNRLSLDCRHGSVWTFVA